MSDNAISELNCPYEPCNSHQRCVSPIDSDPDSKFCMPCIQCEGQYVVAKQCNNETDTVCCKIFEKIFFDETLSKYICVPGDDSGIDIIKIVIPVTVAICIALTAFILWRCRNRCSRKLCCKSQDIENGRETLTNEDGANTMAKDLRNGDQEQASLNGANSKPGDLTNGGKELVQLNGMASLDGANTEPGDLTNGGMELVPLIGAETEESEC